MARSQEPRNLPRNREKELLAPKPVSVLSWPTGPKPCHLRHSHAISAVCMPTDPNILSLSGKVLPSCDLARRYGLQDVDGKSSGQQPAWPTLPSLSYSLLLSLSHSLPVLSPSHPIQSLQPRQRCSRRGGKDLIFLLFLLSAGRPVQDYLSLSSVLSHVSHLRWLASYLPGFLRMPKWVMTLYTSKF